MESSSKLIAGSELLILRESIRKQYLTYYNRDSLRFPLLEFNTNRANYEPLRDSFETEFFDVRGHDRQNRIIHIPSTATLAQLFTDDSYVPGPKIWNTCQLYGANAPGTANDRPVDVPILPETEPVRRRSNWLLLTGSGLVVGLVIGLVAGRQWTTVNSSQSTQAVETIGPARDLMIIRPITNSRMTPAFIVGGQASPGEKVWLVMHFQDTNYYWVQFPALTSDNGGWVAVIEISGAGFDKAGQTHELRAFTSPVSKLSPGDILRTWPEAKRATDVIKVVIDPENGHFN